MTGYLLDTNVISELNKPSRNAGVVSFIAAQPLDELYLSDITFAEIRFGISKVSDALKRATLESFLDEVRRKFTPRVLPLSENVIYRWRLLVDHGRKTGHTFSQPDLFIAATALEHALTVVTRDVSDFARTGVALVNPWSN